MLLWLPQKGGCRRRNKKQMNWETAWEPRLGPVDDAHPWAPGQMLDGSVLDTYLKELAQKWGGRPKFLDEFQIPDFKVLAQENFLVPHYYQYGIWERYVMALFQNGPTTASRKLWVDAHICPKIDSQKAVVSIFMGTTAKLVFVVCVCVCTSVCLLGDCPQIRKKTWTFG